MLHSSDRQLAFVWRPRDIKNVVDAAYKSTTTPIFALDDLDTDVAQALKNAGGRDVYIDSAAFFDEGLDQFIEQSGVSTLWVEYHQALGDKSAEDFLARLTELNSRLKVIPVSGDWEVLELLCRRLDPSWTAAVKGAESAGLGASDSVSVAFATLQEKASPNGPQLVIWGGASQPEGAAAFLACGAAGVVFESVHWLTDLVQANAPDRLNRLRPDQTAVVGANLGLNFRLYDKGNSLAIKELNSWAAKLCHGEPTPEKKAEFLNHVQSQAIHALDSDLGRDQVIPMGPEAAFAQSLVERFGASTAKALAAFRRETLNLLDQEDQYRRHWIDHPTAEELGVKYPFIQGGMSWITDVPEFALSVSQAGGLPTIALGLNSRQVLEERLKRLKGVMKDAPYAINCIVLPENPFREEQLALLEEIRPPFVVIAAGDPSFASRLLNQGIQVIYVAADEGLMRLALRAGVKLVVLEGSEAGGHVGEMSTLTLAQTALDLKRREPSLFDGCRIALAGGIFNRRTAYWAAWLGADAIQMGTVYLSTKEIVESGALKGLYQDMIIKAAPPATVISGRSIGLRVRAIKTPKIDQIMDLERDFDADRQEEAPLRRKLEELSAGSLLIAARGCSMSTGRTLDDEACLAEGQFMSGAAAGAVSQVTTVAELHRELAEGDLGETEEQTASFAPRRPAYKGPDPRERIAVTGWSLANALGETPQEIWENSVHMRTGVTEVPLHRWDHGGFYDPQVGRPEKTYCRVGAFMNLDIDRKALGIPPQDFRTMSKGTRLTMHLADRAINDSDIVKSPIARDRIGVIISQNSGESASTMSDLVLNIKARELVQSFRGLMEMTPELESAIEKRIKSGCIVVDDTTLVGRLSCTAGGFICNKYSFTGPSYAVTAACATSQVALFSAIQMIRNGVLDAAVVGGGEELLTPAHFVEFSALGALAGISGRSFPAHQACRPFDLHRDGMVLGEGGGMLVIERESAAKKRGARIYGYISGLGASNNDQGIVESLAESQSQAIRSSFRDAAYDQPRIDLVECHATGTLQGDVEEIKALKQTFPRAAGAVLASFKSQIGHTLGASGMNNLIRGVMAMNAQIIPGTLNYDTPDPNIDLESWGFRVPGEPEPWTEPADGGPRRAMLNAFGFGGANYVIHLEENREYADTVLVDPKPAVLPSAPETHFGVSFYQTRLSGRDYRLAVIADDDASAKALISRQSPVSDPPTAAGIRKLSRSGVFLAPEDAERQPMAFVFAGQGTAYPGMGKALYDGFPLIREWMDRIAAKVTHFDLLSVMFEGAADDLRNTTRQQPALFCLEYAVLQQLLALGLTPDAAAGHSLGEVAALCVAGVMDWTDGLALVLKRAELMDRAARESADPGGMIAVTAPVEKTTAVVGDREDIYFTNYNSPGQVVLGGAVSALDEVKAELEAAGLRCVPLKVSMAFHSPIMKTIRADMEEFVKGLELSPPTMTVMSNAARKPYSDDLDEIRQDVVSHLESPVYWMQNVQSLYNDFGVRLFVELGPTDALSNLILDTVHDADCLPVSLREEELPAWRTALARLYTVGRLTPPAPCPRVSLPQEKPEPAAEAPSVAAAPAKARPPADIQSVIQREINAFVLDTFGKYLKPALLEAVKREVDPSFDQQKLEAALKSMGAFSPAPAASTPPPSAAAVEAPPVSEAHHPPQDPIEAVIAIIMDATGYERDEIDADMDIRTDLAIRSSRLPVIMDAAEKEFHVKIKLEDFVGLRTVRELAEKLAEVSDRDAAPASEPAQAGAEPASQPAPAPELDFVEEVIQIIMDATGYERDEIEPDMDVRSDLAIRSSRLPVIMDAAEKRFNIQIRLEDFVGLRTIRELAEKMEDIAQSGPGAPLESTPLETRAIAPKAASSPAVETTPVKPVKRLVFEQRPLAEAQNRPMTFSGRKVAILSFGRGVKLAKKTSEYFKRQLHAAPLVMDIKNGFDLRTSSGAAHAAQLLDDSPNLSGLVLVLDADADSELADAREAAAFLTGFFQCLKQLVRSADRKLCLLVTRIDDQSPALSAAADGVLGLFLAAGQEYESVLFRSVGLDAAADPDRALRRALDTDASPAQIIVRGETAHTLHGVQRPIDAARPAGVSINPGDVIVLTGGGRGVTAHLAEALAVYKPRLHLLGRTAVELPAKAPFTEADSPTDQEVREVLLADKPAMSAVELDAETERVQAALAVRRRVQRLNDLGAEAAYHQCDAASPDDVDRVMARIIDAHGRVDGIIHGAGLIRDSFLDMMTPADFQRVVEVKLLGADNLYRAAEARGLRFMVGLSSIVAIQGNVGQANYCAANRAMSALLREIAGRNPEVYTKAIMLPPISGAGMADNEELRELFKLRGMEDAFVHVDEVAHFFSREIALAPASDAWTLVARMLPEVSGVDLEMDDRGSGLTALGASFQNRDLPLIDAVEAFEPQRGRLVLSRTFSHDRDPWLKDHKPLAFLNHPLVSAIMVVEAFMEAARLAAPHLAPVGVRDVEYLDIIEVPMDQARETRIIGRGLRRHAGELVCDLEMESRDISPKGRALDQWTTCYKGSVVLAPDHRLLSEWAHSPLADQDLTIPGLDPEAVVELYENHSALTGRYRVLERIDGASKSAGRGRMVYGQSQDFAGSDPATYQFPTYLLESLLQFSGFRSALTQGLDGPKGLPRGIAEMSFTRPAEDGERFVIEAVLVREDDQGQVSDLRAVDENGETVMIARGVEARWFKR